MGCFVSRRKAHPVRIIGGSRQGLLPVQLGGWRSRRRRRGDPAQERRPFRAMASADRGRGGAWRLPWRGPTATGARTCSSTSRSAAARRRAGALSAGDGGHATNRLIKDSTPTPRRTIGDVTYATPRKLLDDLVSGTSAASPRSTSDYRALHEGWSLARLEREEGLAPRRRYECSPAPSSRATVITA